MEQEAVSDIEFVLFFSVTAGFAFLLGWFAMSNWR
jgi:hypothetical protein